MGNFWLTLALVYAVLKKHAIRKGLRVIPIAALVELAGRIVLSWIKHRRGVITKNEFKQEVKDHLKGMIYLDVLEDILSIFAGETIRLVSVDTSDIDSYYATYQSYDASCSSLINYSAGGGSQRTYLV